MTNDSDDCPQFFMLLSDYSQKRSMFEEQLRHHHLDSGVILGLCIKQSLRTEVSEKHVSQYNSTILEVLGAPFDK